MNLIICILVNVLIGYYLFINIYFQLFLVHILASIVVCIMIDIYIVIHLHSVVIAFLIELRFDYIWMIFRVCSIMIYLP